MASTQELAERFNEAFNRRDLEALDGLTHPDSEFRAPGHQVFRGKAGGRQFNSGWFDAFPDSHTTVSKFHVAGDVSVLEGVFEGTHTGILRTPMGDIPPTGKKLRGEYCNITRWDGGLARDGAIYYDVADLMIQLGLMPEPATV
jgi:ketosteroid isomerase-like protein